MADAKTLAKEEIDNLTSQEEDFENEFQEPDSENTELDMYSEEMKDELNSHKKIRSSISGKITLLEQGHSKTVLQTTKEMVVDELGLIHSGFIFGAAEYAAIISINQENQVVVGSKNKFLAPAKEGDEIEFEAVAKFEDLRKREVKVTGHINEIKIFEGIFQIVILEQHILKTKIKNIPKNYHNK